MAKQTSVGELVRVDVELDLSDNVHQMLSSYASKHGLTLDQAAEVLIRLGAAQAAEAERGE